MAETSEIFGPDYCRRSVNLWFLSAISAISAGQLNKSKISVGDRRKRGCADCIQGCVLDVVPAR